MSLVKHPLYEVRYWRKPMFINDKRNVPISDSAAAQLRQDVTRKLSSLPAQLQQLAVGTTWERSAEQSMSEYQLLDAAAQSIDMLKAMNIRDRDMIQSKAKRKLKEEESAVLNAIKFRICPEEMDKTRNDMRKLRDRGCQICCVDDCMPEIMDGIDLHWSYEPDFVPELRKMEGIMDKVRATAIKLQTDKPDGHWATGLLNFYSDSWMVWLDAFNMNFQDNWYGDVLDEEMEGAKQRAKVAEEVVKEIEKERRQKSFEKGWYGTG